MQHYSSVQCLQRWQKVLKPGLIKGSWTAEEDKLLRELVAQGLRNWGKVASHIPGRTSKQCRERWCQHLDPSLLKTEFSAEEDITILQLHAKIGNRWAAIARELPGRTENMVKIRFKSLERAQISRKEAISLATSSTLVQASRSLSLPRHSFISSNDTHELHEDVKLFCEALSLVSKSPSVPSSF